MEEFVLAFVHLCVCCVHLSLCVYLCLCRQGQAEAVRRRAIDESKFLGGDMKHTHLVKGLDYVLKQKVRGAIVAWEEKDKEGEGGRYTRTHTRTHTHACTHTHWLWYALEHMAENC